MAKNKPKLKELIDNHMTDLIIMHNADEIKPYDNLDHSDYASISVVEDGLSSESNNSPNKMSASSNPPNIALNPAIYLNMQKKNLRAAGAYQTSIKIKVHLTK
jgi:hypothetical protein